MDFVEIDILCQQDLKDILTAELCEIGYESFLDTPNGFRAYQPVKNHNPETVTALLSRYELKTRFKSRKLTDKNWNELWEKTFEPIEIDKKCRIRASFHAPGQGFDYEIVIDPKMAFGTGHHETTRQMVRYQLELDLNRSEVLDVGCGTGILSILAEKQGAVKVIGLDIDPYAISNTVENIMLNDCKKIRVKEGTIKNLGSKLSFDLIVANINRNVLIEEIENYSDLLNTPGYLILSGFYTWDAAAIVKKSEGYSLSVASQMEENQWSCVLLEKNQP